MRSARVVVVGGGIGGTAAALALRARGLDVAVYERAAEFREIGSGLVLSPNGVNAAGRLGPRVAEALRRDGWVSRPRDPTRFLRADGGILFEGSFGDMEARYGAPMISIPRTRLHDALRAELPPECLHAGCALERVEERADGVSAHFRGGGSAHGEVLVGADGIWSVARAHVDAAAKPRFLGAVSIRGVSPLPDHPFCGSGNGFISGGRGVQLFATRLSADRMYWAATANAGEGTAPRDPEAARAWLLERVRGWHEPVEEMVRSAPAEALVVTDVHDLDPLPRWSTGRVTLLGDAAHAMSPFMGQGANMALEDAVVLADALADAPTPAAAFAAYEARRRERTRKVVLQSRQIGKMGQLENRLAMRLRDGVMSLMMRLVPPNRQNDWMFGYTA